MKCWSKISLDLIGPLKESNGKKYFISCVDYFSKYVEDKAIENKTGSAAGTFVYDLICRYSVMDITITDQGNLYLNCNVHLHLISKFTNVFHFNEYIYSFCTHTVCIMIGNVKMYIIHLNC